MMAIIHRENIVTMPRGRRFVALAALLGAASSRAQGCVEFAKSARVHLPGQRLDPPLGFVHPTKTGGTAIRFMACPDLRCYKGHHATAGFWHKMGMRSIAIIREPVERFVSAFDYAKGGSEIHKGQELSAPGKYLEVFQRFTCAADFVNALADKGHWSHAAAVEALTKREDGRQFRNQTAWIKGAPRNRVTIGCYSEEMLSQNLERLLRKLGSDCSVALSAINKSNRSFSRAPGQPEPACALKENHTRWVKALYPQDVMLYASICSRRAPHLTQHSQI